MSTLVSVVSVADRNHAAFRGLLRSLDEQTLAPEAFEVVIADGGLAERDRTIMTTIASCRPNMRFVPSDSGSALASAIAAARGDYVLAVGMDARLYPDALRVLSQRAVDTSSEAVLGKPVSRSAPTLAWQLMTTDGPADRRMLDTARLKGYPVLATRQLTTAVAAPAVALDDLRIQVLTAAESVEVVASYPAVASDAGGIAPLEGSFRVATSSASWGEDGVLEIMAAVDGPTSTLTGAEVWARSKETGEDWPLRSELSTDLSAPSVRALLDPSRAALGTSLSPGRWMFDVRLAAGEQDFSLGVPLESGVPAPALVDGVITVPFKTRSGLLGVDIGATHRSALSALEANWCTVREDARGTLLRVDLPFGSVRKTSSMAGQLFIGTFAVKARLVTAGPDVWLEAWLSGLAGSADLSTDFGGVGKVPTGLMLVIAGDGVMSVRAAEPTAEQKQTAPVSPASGSRLLPALWDRVKRVPGARRAHRRLKRLL